MTDFVMRFLICNLLIAGLIGILLIAKQLFKNTLSSRMQYHLWYLLLCLLAVPFLPFVPIGFPWLVTLLSNLNDFSAAHTGAGVGQTSDTDLAGEADWLNDFAISVSSDSPSMAALLLFGIWSVGMLVMLGRMIHSYLRLQAIKKSALPLQNQNVRCLYRHCLRESGITRDIPIFSTAFLKSPMITGLFRPRIYLPIHLISDGPQEDIRYMLLHELQHYRHMDAVANYLMNLAAVVYWFNPAVWFALKQMRNEREIACDTSVLKRLEKAHYEAYGNTLINFAHKISHTPFPFTTGLSGHMKQMTRRIIHIASYEEPTLGKKLKGTAAFVLTASLLVGLAPVLSTCAAGTDRYQWQTAPENITITDLSSYFGEYEGCFVLYDLENDTWRVHDLERALVRTSPNSTYKIYNALFGLEEGVITPDNSLLPWNGETYPYKEWNADQTLSSAMHSSVNWYFQEIDKQLGASCIKSYIHKIGYGNENLSSGLSSYWLESSLQISAIEQVELLTKLYQNDFGFSPDNVKAVKAAMLLSSSEAFYGKTGTGRVNGQDVNGCFVGYMETAYHTYFFATNIQAGSNAAGSSAADITRSILSDMNILS